MIRKKGLECALDAFCRMFFGLMGCRKIMEQSEKYKRIVFCDFDGTITVEETFVGMLKCFAGVRYEEVERLMLARTLTIREGVRRLVESIPSKRYPEMLDYIRGKEIRRGLPELLAFLQAQNVPFVVISGGILGSVLTRLEAFAENIHAFYAADVRTFGEYLQVYSRFEGETELVAKATIMSRYEVEETVAIGDGISDLNMALHSSVVFARGNLGRHLEKRGKHYRTWDDFFDVRRQLVECWGLSQD